MQIDELIRDATPFLRWVGDWKDALPALELSAEIDEPHAAAVFSVDVINGFCYQGPLSSPRVAAIVPPIVSLFERARQLGVSHFVLTQDRHEQHAVEFASFAPHAIQGTVESQAVPEFQALAFFDEFVIIPKNSTSSSIGTKLPAWLDAHPKLRTFVVVGDCTDLCTYQLAMYLRLRANAQQRAADRVIVPVNSVQTYDLSVEVAADLGIFPHHGDLLHLIYLYSMALNGIEVAASI